MDPNGGINPSAPKLDNTQPPTDIYQQAVEPQSPLNQITGASIPPEIPSVGPEIQAPLEQAPQMQPPQQPQFPGQFADPYQQDPNVGVQPIEPDPMLSQPMADAPLPVQNDGKKKILIIAAATIFGLAVLGGASFMAYTAGKSAGKQEAAAEFQAQQAATQEAEAADKSSVEDVTLELGELSALNPKEETLTGVTGEQINSSDGFVLYVTNIERSFTVDDPSYELDEGKELVKVNFIMGNTTQDRPKDIKSADLFLEEGDGTKITPESRLSDYSGNFDTVKIEPGAQASGSIVFAVKKDAAPLVFVREQRYRITNQNKEVATKTSVVVAE
jgi:hypothetical protein